MNYRMNHCTQIPKQSLSRQVHMISTLMCMATLEKKITCIKSINGINVEEFHNSFWIKKKCNLNGRTKQIYAGMYPFNLPTSEVLNTVSLVIKMKEAL